MDLPDPNRSLLGWLLENKRKTLSELDRSQAAIGKRAGLAPASTRPDGYKQALHRIESRKLTTPTTGKATKEPPGAELESLRAELGLSWLTIALAKDSDAWRTLELTKGRPVGFADQSRLDLIEARERLGMKPKAMAEFLRVDPMLYEAWEAIGYVPPYVFEEIAIREDRLVDELGDRPGDVKSAGGRAPGSRQRKPRASDD